MTTTPDTRHRIAVHLGGFESVEEILRGVVRRHGLARRDLSPTPREREDSGGFVRVKRAIVEARREAVVLLRERRNMSYPEIAAALGFRAHSCVHDLYQRKDGA